MKISREDIYLITRHSNCSEESIDQTLKTEVYADAAAWRKFIQLLCISLGITFMTLGIVFFFAYNWADLHKFTKIGMVQGLIVLTTATALLPNIKWNIRRIILMGSSMLVGVLFAVLGQIYQTGANAYDFFLGWTLFIALWVLVSSFAPLWLMFLTLINTTFILYTDQVAHGWSEIAVSTSLFVLNTFFLVASIFMTKKPFERVVPHWFTRIIALAAIYFATTSVSMGLFYEYEHPLDWWFAIALTAIAYSVGIIYGLKTRDPFYLAAIPFSVILIICAVLTRLVDDGVGLFFIIALFVVGSVTWLIKTLLHLQKKWNI